MKLSRILPALLLGLLLSDEALSAYVSPYAIVTKSSPRARKPSAKKIAKLQLRNPNAAARLRRTTAQSIADDTRNRGVVNLGPVEARAGVGFDVGYNSNLYLTKQATGSMQTFIKPALQLALRTNNERNVYNLGVAAVQNIYESSSINDYLDRYITANTHTDLGMRHQLDWNSNLTWSHFMRGELLSQTGSATQVYDPNNLVFSFEAPVQYESKNTDLKYTYGSSTAKGNLEFRAGYLSYRYTNYADYYERLNYDAINAGTTFYYRVSPKTQLLAEFNNVYYDYVNETEGAATDGSQCLNGSTEGVCSSLDNNFRTYYVGATWKALSKTTGTAKVGWMEKEFSSSGETGASGLSWQLGLTWEPLTYSTFMLGTGKTLQPTISTANALLEVTSTSASWSHDWTRKVSTTLGVMASDQVYVGGSSFSYKTRGVNASADYALKHWLKTGVSAGYTDRSSTSEFYTGSGYQMMFHIQMTPP